MPSKPPETEKGFQATIVALATLHGWMVYHPWKSLHSQAGWPDLCLAKPGRLIFAELKSATGKLTEAQLTWLTVLGSVAEMVEVYLWRPADFPTIERLLAPAKPSTVRCS